MKTATDLAIELLDHICPGYSQGDLIYLEKKIKYDRKKQDKISRHACAEAVLSCDMKCYTPANGVCIVCISPHDAHNACMNVKAV